MYWLLCQFLPLYSQLWLPKSSQQISQLCLIPKSLRFRPGGILETNSLPAGMRKLVCRPMPGVPFPKDCISATLSFLSLIISPPFPRHSHCILLSHLPLWVPGHKPQAQTQLSRALSFLLAPADLILQALIPVPSIVIHWLLSCLISSGTP